MQGGKHKVWGRSSLNRVLWGAECGAARECFASLSTLL